MAEMRLYDSRVTVEPIEAAPFAGMKPGDSFELVESSKLRIPEGGHFCAYALQAMLPLLPAKQRRLPAGDWLEQDGLVCCPDPDERRTSQSRGRCRRGWRSSRRASRETGGRPTRSELPPATSSGGSSHLG